MREVGFVSGEWQKFGQRVEQASSCEELQEVYHDYCTFLIKKDGTVDQMQWKEFSRNMVSLQRFFNKRSRRLCGYTYFDPILRIEADGYGDAEEWSPDFESGEAEDSFDYDEFDSSR